MQKYELKEILLEVNKITVQYGNNIIIKDFSMLEKNVVSYNSEEVKGQCIAVVSQSGRGKSTLFRCLSGLMKPSEGIILVKDFNHEEGAKLVEVGDMSLVDQRYTLFRHKTVYQTLLFAMRNVKLSYAPDSKNSHIDKHSVIIDSLSNWNLLNQKNKYPHELSGGQRQRVAILEKILSGGHFIIFDEPASGLDVSNIQKLKDNFKSIGKANDLNTIIFSTHDINLAVEMADIIYVLGHKEKEDTFSTNVATFDLKKLGLAWEEFSTMHIELVKEITETIKNS